MILHKNKITAMLYFYRNQDKRLCEFKWETALTVWLYPGFT